MCYLTFGEVCMSVAPITIIFARYIWKDLSHLFHLRFLEEIHVVICSVYLNEVECLYVKYQSECE